MFVLLRMLVFLPRYVNLWLAILSSGAKSFIPPVSRLKFVLCRTSHNGNKLVITSLTVDGKQFSFRFYWLWAFILNEKVFRRKSLIITHSLSLHYEIDFSGSFATWNTKEIGSWWFIVNWTPMCKWSFDGLDIRWVLTVDCIFTLDGSKVSGIVSKYSIFNRKLNSMNESKVQ